MEPQLALWLAAWLALARPGRGAALAATEAADTLARPLQPFRVYWNVPTFGCHRYGMRFEEVSAWGAMQNEGDAFRGERIAILYDPGQFPALLAEPGGRRELRNGGAPQQGNLTAHLAALAADIDRLVPDVNFSGVGVLDMESWRPVWRQLFGAFKEYKEFSRQVERDRHPLWSPDQIEQSAHQRFETAARSFMEASLELVKHKRPRAVWGYYAFPFCFNSNQANCAPQVQRENDKLQWLFDGSGALFPSLYLGARAPAPGDRRTFVLARLREALRVARRTPSAGRPRVLAYVRYNFFDSGAFLSKDDLFTSISTPKNMGVDGVVVWGSWNDVTTQQKCEALQTYVHQVLGPVIKNLTLER